MSKAIILRVLVGAGVLGFCVLGAWGCGSKGDAGSTAADTTQGKAQAKNQAKARGGRPGHPGRPGGGAFGNRQAGPPATVAVIPVSRGTIASRYTASATLEAEKQATVLARVSGVIESIQAEEGDSVQEGQVLLRIGDQEFQYRATQVASELATARAKYDRGKKLLEQNVLSSEAFDDLRNAFEGAEANVGLAELNVSYTKVAAPFSGRVVQRLVDPGQTVSTGTQLFTLADFTPLLAKVHVPSKMFGKLQQEQPVELILDSSGARLTGRIKLVSPVIDPQSGTIKLTIEVPTYPADTRPGDFVEVRVVTERHDQAILVPKVAVFEEKGEHVAFVAADTSAVRRIVEVGFQDEAHAEILSGLEPGEDVIVRGQRNLKDGQPIRIREDVISKHESR